MAPGAGHHRARALGLDGVIGSLTPGKKADTVLIKNDRSPVMFPLPHPYGHVAHQAGCGDVHTVLVNGAVVKHEHQLTVPGPDRARSAVEATFSYARTTMGEEAWRQAREPIPETEVIPNPYAYTDYRGEGVAVQHANE